MSGGLRGEGIDDGAADKPSYCGNQEQHPPAERCVGFLKKEDFAMGSLGAISREAIKEQMPAEIQHPVEGDCAEAGEDADDDAKEN